MNNFNLYMPTKIYFGKDILENAIEKEKNLFAQNIIIITTGKSLIKFGHLDKFISCIKKYCSNSNINIFDEISANPKFSEIQKAVAIAQNCKASVVIGFGGGSSIDAAKAVATLVNSKKSINDFFYNGFAPGEETLPIIAIPTTAGTGSELSKAAIITDDVQKIKSGIRGEKIYPKVAIVDSSFTESVPFNVTMETGFDVFAHALESYVSVASSDFTKMLSLEAAKIVYENLPLLSKDLSDADARKKMSYASMIMGINLGNASTCLPHRLQYPLGSHTNTSHGAGLASLYCAWIGYEFIYAKDLVKKFFYEIFGVSPISKENCSQIIHDFLVALKLPICLKDLGVSYEQLDVMVQEVQGNIKNDLASSEKNIIEKIYQESFTK